MSLNPTCHYCKSSLSFDRVHYDTNNHCFHCNKWICINHTAVIYVHDAYILELHCTDCAVKCKKCELVCCKHKHIDTYTEYFTTQSNEC